MTVSKLLPAFALVGALLFATNASAAEKVIDGCKVVKTDGNKLFVTGPDGGEHSAEVAADAKITVDGKETKLADLKAGLGIKVTIDKGDSGIKVLKIEGSTK